MIARALVLSILIAGAGWYSSRTGVEATAASHPPLAELPRSVGPWIESIDVPLDRNVRTLLGADDYVNRTYVNEAGQPVSLYVGYYASQRQGDTIHSPQNCLPGAGWQPIEGGSTSLDLAPGRIVVNRYVIQKGIDRQVVLYWYQGRGRVIANEFANRFWLMFDAAVRHRSSGALVRVNAPVRSATGSLASADAAVAEFTRALFPRLSNSLP